MQLGLRRLLIAIVLQTAVLFSFPTSAQDIQAHSYVDPQGFFELHPPEGWTVQEYSDDPRGKVAFFGPQKVELRILVSASDFSSAEEFVDAGKEIERNIGIDTNIRIISFVGREAIERTFIYNGTKFYYIDILVGNTYHNLAYGAPPELFDEFSSVALASMATHTPLTNDISDDDVVIFAVAKIKRLRELGQHQAAATILEDTLVLFPDREELLMLR